MHLKTFAAPFFLGVTFARIVGKFIAFACTVESVAECKNFNAKTFLPCQHHQQLQTSAIGAALHHSALAAAVQVSTTFDQLRLALIKYCIGQTTCRTDDCGDGSCCMTGTKKLCCVGGCNSPIDSEVDTISKVAEPSGPPEDSAICAWSGTAPFCVAGCDNGEPIQRYFNSNVLR